MDELDIKVSVIIPSLNLGKFVEQTLDSVLMQNYHNIEVIVIDGASTDNTLTILSRYPTIELYSESDRGIVEALQRGVEKSTGDLVMFMMISDGYLDSKWISKCVQFLSAHPTTSLCFGLPRYMSEAGELGEVSYERWLTKPPVSQVAIFEHWLSTGWHFPECNMCIRKPVIEGIFQTIDPLDDSIDVFLEFTLRFHTAGFLSNFLPVVANFGRLHGGQRGEVEQQSGTLRNRLLVYQRGRKRFVKDLFMRRRILIFKTANGSPLGTYAPSLGGICTLASRYAVDVLKSKLICIAISLTSRLRHQLRFRRD